MISEETAFRSLLIEGREIILLRSLDFKDYVSLFGELKKIK